MKTQNTIPLVDLALAHGRVSQEVQQGFDRVLSQTSFILGPEVAAFESEFATYCGVNEVVGVANGTDALEIAMASCGIGSGDEVIIPANTFVATAEAVVRCGARVVLVDCDEHYLIDPQLVASRMTSRTRAVVAVHLYGQTAAVEELREVVGPEVLLVEDAAQAQGARRFDTRAGALGDVAATSFYPGKNLGAYGDAGAVMTSDSDVASLARKLRNHGGTQKYEHVKVGRNSRLGGLQAVVLSAKLRVLDDWNQERREAALLYDKLLSDLDRVVLPRTLPGNEHVHHLYVVRVPDRDRVVDHLNAAGVGAGVHYPSPVHLLPAFSFIGDLAGSHPLAERFSSEILSLPIFPGITEDQQSAVVRALEQAVV